VSPPPKDADDNDVVEVIDAPSAVSKGKQKALPSKTSKSSKPSVVVMTKDPTAQPKLSKPSDHVVPPPEKQSPTTGAPKDFMKTLGELESLVLVASAELKRAQAETEKAEGTLDVVMSEIRSFRTKYDL
jgi:thiamine pyrophosphate-dependent acetolactate synthase large subunit-like protein